jgi:hypothetical protein
MKTHASHNPHGPSWRERSTRTKEMVHRKKSDEILQPQIIKCTLTMKQILRRCNGDVLATNGLQRNSWRYHIRVRVWSSRYLGACKGSLAARRSGCRGGLFRQRRVSKVRQRKERPLLRRPNALADRLDALSAKRRDSIHVCRTTAKA